MSEFHNLKLNMFLLKNLNILCARFFTSSASQSPKTLYKFLIRQCKKLPKGPREHYQFQIKQSFKQHINETDPERIKEIIKRSYEDTNYVINKYLGKK